MPNLTTLLLEQPAQTKLAINKFLYRTGTNVALYNATRDRITKVFKEKVKTTIQYQVEQVSQAHFINEIGNEFTPTIEIISKYYTPFNEAFPGGVAAIDRFYRWAGKQGGQAALDKLGIGKVRKAINATFDLRDPRLIAQLGDYRNLLIDSVDATTKIWIADTIAMGQDNDLTPDEIAQLLADGAEQLGTYRSGLIVDTELAQAMCYVERQTYIENDVTMMQWQTSEDATVDDVCAANEDQGPIPVDEAFDSGDNEPPAHPNCRCYIEPVFDNNFLMREGDFFNG